MSDYPLLWNLMGVYLNQDYDLFAPDPEAAFLVGVREGYLDRLPELLRELSRLEAQLSRLDEDAGGAVLQRLGSELHLAALGHTPVTWIAHLERGVRTLAS